MKQADKVMQAILNNGGTATLKELYKLVDTSEWLTHTPEASIRRIVQQDKRLEKVKPGLYKVKERV
jgi:hypothetical protein